MKCYNCGRREELIRMGKGLVSTIDRIETDLEQYSDEEEKYLPLCQACVALYEKGKLGDIEEKWIDEKDKWIHFEGAGAEKSVARSRRRLASPR